MRSETAQGEAPDQRPDRRRHRELTPLQRAVVIAALATVLGSLFLTTYSLALADPVPHRIDAALVGDPASNQPTVSAVEAVAEHALPLAVASVGGDRHLAPRRHLLL